MSGFLGSLFDKDNPVKRLEKEIQNTEFKKQSLIAPFQDEINAARQKIDGVLYQIGKDTYECHQSGEEPGDRLAARFDEISALQALVAEKEAKIETFTTRYDEEIAILRTNLASTVAKAGETAQGQPYYGPQDKPYRTAQDADQTDRCKSCGRPYNAQEDVFCMGCGQKLEQ